MKNLIIIGARGFGRDVYQMVLSTEIYKSGELTLKGFLDDKADAFDGMEGNLPPILGPVETYDPLPDDRFVCALGDGYMRKHYTNIVEKKGGKFISVIAPTAIVATTAIIEEGAIIGMYSIVCDHVRIGRHSIVLGFSCLGHDSCLRDYASIESYVFLGGYSIVGELTTMHTRSTLLPRKSIGRGCTVGVGSVVMRDSQDGERLFGNPAKKIDY